VVLLLRQNGSPSEGSPTEAVWFDQRLLAGKRANWGEERRQVGGNFDLFRKSGSEVRLCPEPISQTN
jgi:hypothetical protein